MGVTTPKGPNPFETNTGAARYTQLSQFKNDFLRAGLPGDAEAIFGRGLDVTTQPVAGDVALLGNRIGVVTGTSKTGVNYNNVTLKYKNQVTGELDTIQIVLRSTVTVPTNAVLGGHVGYACSLGTILFLKSRTDDPQTWTPEARAAAERNVAAVVEGVMTQNVTSPIGDTSPHAICLDDDSKQFTLTGAVGDIQWQKGTDGVTYADIDSAIDTTFTVDGDAVAGANYFRAKVSNGFRTRYSNAIRVYYKVCP